jgi:hypothetical protein
MGVVLFVVTRIAEIRFEVMARAILPWLAPLLVVLAAIALWPPLTLWLPTAMRGGARSLGDRLNAAGVRGIRQASVTIGGAGLHWHDMASHFKPGTGMLQCRFATMRLHILVTFARAQGSSLQRFGCAASHGGA